MSAIRGECNGNFRSTPSPCTMRRTMNISRDPLPDRPMTTPLKTWIRSLSPSRIRTWTSTVSPMSNLGVDDFMVDCSTTLISWFCIVPSFPNGSSQPGMPGSPLSAAVGPAPSCDRGVVAAEQDLRDRPAAVDARPGVLRILESSVRPKGLVDGALGIPKHSGDQPHDRVEDNHRGHLTSREDEIADRKQFGLKNLDDAFIEALVPSAEQDQARFAGQLG